MIEHKIFCNLLHLCRLNLEISHWTQFKFTLLQHFNAMQKDVLWELSKSHKISIELDCWTSSNQYSFLAITDYFITDAWQYCEVLLAFKPLHSKHSENNLVSYTMKTLHFYNIVNQLLVITADNAWNNGKLHRQLQKKLRKESVIWNSQQETIHCMTHTIQLAVNEFFTMLKIIKTSNLNVNFDDKKIKFNHIISYDSDYNNVFQKICKIITVIYYAS